MRTISAVTRADYVLLKKAVLVSHLYTFLANYSAAFASYMYQLSGQFDHPNFMKISEFLNHRQFFC